MSKYVIKYGESIIDVSLKLYNDISFVFDLIKLNPVLENIDNSNIVGIEISYEPITVSGFKPIVTVVKPITKNVTILENQSVFDLSLQIFGTIEKAFDVIKLADISDINNNEIKGIKFNYNYVPLKIPKYLNDKKLMISTKSNFETDENIIWDGTFDVWSGNYYLGY